MVDFNCLIILNFFLQATLNDLFHIYANLHSYMSPDFSESVFLLVITMLIKLLQFEDGSRSYSKIISLYY
jgi:hypothetical protein